MTAISPEETVLRVSTARNEPVILRVEGGTAVTLRVEVDGSCTCHTGAVARAGSYIDRDLTLA